jgi:hypothetical protein
VVNEGWTDERSISLIFDDAQRVDRTSNHDNGDVRQDESSVRKLRQLNTNPQGAVLVYRTTSSNMLPRIGHGDSVEYSSECSSQASSDQLQASMQIHDLPSSTPPSTKIDIADQERERTWCRPQTTKATVEPY